MKKTQAEASDCFPGIKETCVFRDQIFAFVIFTGIVFILGFSALVIRWLVQYRRKWFAHRLINTERNVNTNNNDDMESDQRTPLLGHYQSVGYNTESPVYQRKHDNTKITEVIKEIQMQPPSSLVFFQCPSGMQSLHRDAAWLKEPLNYQHSDVEKMKWVELSRSDESLFNSGVINEFHPFDTNLSEKDQSLPVADIPSWKFHEMKVNEIDSKGYPLNSQKASSHSPWHYRQQEEETWQFSQELTTYYPISNEKSELFIKTCRNTISLKHSNPKRGDDDVVYLLEPQENQVHNCEDDRTWIYPNRSRGHEFGSALSYDTTSETILSSSESIGYWT